MRFYILTVIFSLLSLATVCAQRQTVTGKLFTVEEQADDALPYAEVTVLSLPDSALVRGTVTKTDGSFRLNYTRKPHTSYLLRASFLGYEPFTALLNTKKDSINLGRICLKAEALKLDGVVVKADMRPVVQRKDSTIYNVAAYRVPQDEYLEALIKRIPGLDYDPETQIIKYNSHVINSILINGQDLFGGDKKLALTNLPIGIIRRVKVYDRRTEAERATGMRRGNKKNYVLDVETKSDMNGMLVGEAGVGAGTASKKDLSLRLMRFEQQGSNVAVIGRSTNRYIDSDYPGNIHRDLTAAISQSAGEKFDWSVTGNYSYNHAGNLSTSRTELYQTSGNRYSISENENKSKGKTIGGSAQFTWRPDSKTSVTFNVYGNTSDSENEGGNRSASFNMMPTVDITNPFADFDRLSSDSKINYGENKQFGKRKDNSLNVMGNVVRTLTERGDNISLTLSAMHNTAKADNYTDASTYYYRLKNSMGADSTDYRKQYINSPTSTLNYSAQLAYTFFITPKNQFQLGYSISKTREKQDGNTYDLSSFSSSDAPIGFLPQGYEQHEIDSLYSRNRSGRLQHTVTVGYDYNGSNTNLSVRMDMSPDRRSIQSRTGSHMADTTAVQTSWMPSVSFSYTPDNFYLQLMYSGYTQQPDLSSLVAATDYSSPLNIIHSNPNLKTSYSHLLNFTFNSMEKGITANASFRQTFNSISQAVFYNTETGGSETYPMNVNGDWGVNGNASYERRFGQFRTYVSGGGSLDNNVSLTANGTMKDGTEKTNTRSLAFNSSLRTSYMPQWGEILLGAFWTFQSSDNSLQNIKSYNRIYRVNAETNLKLPLGFGFKSDALYVLRSGTGISSENRNEVVWNMSLSYKFLKQKKARVEVEWVDILNQCKDYYGSASSTGFYENYRRKVGSYVMFSFSYRI